MKRWRFVLSLAFLTMCFCGHSLHAATEQSQEQRETSSAVVIARFTM